MREKRKKKVEKGKKKYTVRKKEIGRQIVKRSQVGSFFVLEESLYFLVRPDLGVSLFSF